MQQYGKTLQRIILLAVFAGVFSGQPVRAQECDESTSPDPGLMTADVALARPVGAVATVAGFAVYLVSSPFSALGGNTHEAWENLVVSPATYTFKRPLGHFDCEHPPIKK